MERGYALRELIYLGACGLFGIFVGVYDTMDYSTTCGLDFRVGGTTLNSFFLLRFLRLTPRLIYDFYEAFGRELITIVEYMISLGRISSVGIKLPFTAYGVYPFFSRCYGASSGSGWC